MHHPKVQVYTTIFVFFLYILLCLASLILRGFLVCLQGHCNTINYIGSFTCNKMSNLLNNAIECTHVYQVRHTIVILKWENSQTVLGCYGSFVYSTLNRGNKRLGNYTIQPIEPRHSFKQSVLCKTQPMKTRVYSKRTMTRSV